MRKSDSDFRREDEIDGAGNRQIGLRAAQTFAGHMNRDERRRTGCVNRNARAAQVEQVGNAVRSDAVRIPRSEVGIDYLKVIIIVDYQIRIVESSDSDENAGPGARQLIRRLPRILEGF